MSESVFNEGSIDVDFRVEGNTNANLLFIDGGNDRVGVGTNSVSSDATFGVSGNIELKSAGNRYYVPRQSDGAITGSLYSRTGNTITLSGAGSSSGQIEFIPSSANSSAVAMTIDSSQLVGIGTASPDATLHTAHSSSTAYNGGAEILESAIIQNTNGTDDSGVNNVASLGLQVASGATSQGFINYVRTGNNTGNFTFSQRTGSSSYAEHMKIENDGTVVIPGAIQSTGNVSITSTAKYFQVMSHIDTSKKTVHAYDGLYTHGSQNMFIQSAQDIKFYPGGAQKVVFTSGGKVGIGETNPSEELHISANQAAPTCLRIEAKSTGERADINLYGIKTDNGGFAEILFVNNGDSTGAISCEREGANDAGAIVFTTQATGAGMTEKMRINSEGVITQPSQPAFCVIIAQDNNKGTNTNYQLALGTERFDQGGNVSSNQFRAPVTGKYQLNAIVRLTEIPANADYIIIQIVTDNDNYSQVIEPTTAKAYEPLCVSVLADMDANDTAHVGFLQGGGSAQTDIDSESFFSGYLVA